MRTRLLYITSLFPGMSSGSQVRSFYILRELAARYEVTVCCVTDQSADIAGLTKELGQNLTVRLFPMKRLTPPALAAVLLRGKIPYVERYGQSVPKEQIRPLLRQTDIIFFSELNGYCIARSHLEGVSARLVLDSHNVEYVKFRAELQAQSRFKALLSGIYTPILKRLEAEALRRVDQVYACSREDAGLLQELAPRARITVLPNGVDCAKFKPAREEEVPIKPGHIVFMGSLDYPPNDDGIRFFITDVFPVVQNAIPEAALTVIGKGASESLKQLAAQNPGVALAGFVEDPRELIASAAVCICPVRFGSGTRLKILEYMAMGKAVVSTRIGAEGINARDGVEITIADDPDEFASAVVGLVKDSARARRIGASAREFVETRYNWGRILQKL